MHRIALIADTHGLLRPEALSILQGSDHVIHAGDIGQAGILHAMSAFAPVTAVRGNNDKGDWADALSEAELLQIDDLWVYALHDLADLDIDPAAAGVRVVVSGHSHKPLIEERGGVLFVNPGSAGPRRFKLPVTVAELLIDGTAVSARIIDLQAPFP